MDINVTVNNANLYLGFSALLGVSDKDPSKIVSKIIDYFDYFQNT